MPHAPVLQPNGLYAIWSSVVDDFVGFNYTMDEYIGMYKQGQEDVLRRAFENIEKVGTAYDWSRDWDGYVKFLEETGRESLNDIDGLWLARRLGQRHPKVGNELETHKYWHYYWRNRCINLETRQGGKDAVD